MNVLGTSLAGASKKKRSTAQERKPSKFLLLLPCMHACMPVLSCSMPWRASIFGYSHRTCIQFRACLFASLLQFLPSPPVRACCVLRACEPSCWEGRRRSGRCSRSLGVISLSHSFANQVGFVHAQARYCCVALRAKRVCTCC